MKFPDIELLKKVKFDRTFYLANMIDLADDNTVISQFALKPIIRFTTPDVYTTIITGFKFGFVSSSIPPVETAPFTNLNLRFQFLIDLQENLFNRGALLNNGGTVGDLPEYEDNDTFIEINPNKDVILGIRDIMFPYSIDEPSIIVYAEVKGYFLTLRREVSKNA